MKVQIKLISKDNTETINIDDIVDNKHFIYVDSYGANNELRILEKGIEIIRESDSHKTLLHLNENDNEKSFVLIQTNEGNLYFDAKVLAFRINNDIITLVYSINEEVKSIEIRTWETSSICQLNQ